MTPSPAGANAAPPDALRPPRPVVLVTGNPNSGKSTLFNALTGAHARVGT